MIFQSFFRHKMHLNMSYITQDTAQTNLLFIPGWIFKILKVEIFHLSLTILLVPLISYYFNSNIPLQQLSLSNLLLPIIYWSFFPHFVLFLQTKVIKLSYFFFYRNKGYLIFTTSQTITHTFFVFHLAINSIIRFSSLLLKKNNSSLLLKKNKYTDIQLYDSQKA